MAATSSLWASGTPTTTGSTWTANTPANAAGANNATFAVFTTSTNAAVGTLTLTGYDAQTAIGATPTSVDSVALTVFFNVGHTGRWTSVTAQLMSGGSVIGSSQTLTLSNGASNSQTLTFTGVSWAQLSTLGVRLSATKSGTQSSTFNVDATGVVVNYTPVATVPNAPTSAAATAGDTSASVTFTAPASDGGSAILDYRVTASPGGATTTGASSPIAVSGLTNGTPYTFTVAARNAVGFSAESTATSAVTPAAPAPVVQLSWARLSIPVTNPTYAQAVQSDSPVAYWRLGETSGTSFADTAGSSTATSSGSPTLNQASLVSSDLGNGSVLFDGVDDYLAVPDSATLDVTAPISLEAWVRPSTLGGAGTFRTIVSKDGAYGFQMNGLKLEWWIAAGGTKTRCQSADSVLTVGNDFHIVGTYDGTTMRLYLNGTQIATLGATVSIAAATSALYIGRYSVGTAESWNGLIDEVALYNTALSATRVAAHTTAGTAASTTLTVADSTHAHAADSPIASPWAKVATLTDDFDTIDNAVWTETVPAESNAVGGELVLSNLSSYPGVTSVAIFDATSSSVLVRNVEHAGGASSESWLQLNDSASANRARIGRSSTVGYFQLTGQTNVTVNDLDITHQWWRIAEAGSTITMSTSADGSSWTQRATFPTPAWWGSVRIRLAGGWYAAQGTGAHRFDKLNLAAAATTLAVADGSHAHTTDSPVLAQQHSLTAAVGAHAHAADSLVLAQAHSLVGQNGSHAHAADSAALVQTHSLTVGDGAHAHAAGLVTLTVDTINLTVDAGSHAHVADGPTITVDAIALTAAITTHAHASDAPALIQTHALSAQSASSAHASDAPALTQAHALGAQNTSSAHAADLLVLTQQHALAADSGVHAHAADTGGLTQTHALAVGDGGHAHATDSPTLAQTALSRVQLSWATFTITTAVILTAHDGTHAHAAGAAALVQQHTLAGLTSAHAHSADPVTLSVVAQPGFGMGYTSGYLPAGTVVLTVAAASHAHAAGEPTLASVQAPAGYLGGYLGGYGASTGQVTLAVGSAVHAHNAGAVAIMQAHTLAAADGSHAHTADTPGLLLPGQLSLADTAHEHAAETVTVVQQHTLVLAAPDVLEQYAQQVSLTLLTSLAEVASTAHDHTAGTVVIAVGAGPELRRGTAVLDVQQIATALLESTPAGLVTVDPAATGQAVLDGTPIGQATVTGQLGRATVDPSLIAAATVGEADVATATVLTG